MNTLEGDQTAAVSAPEPAPSPFSWLANRAKKNQQTRLPAQRLYRLSEAARILNVCMTTLRRRAKRQQISTVRFGKGWHYVTETELRRISGEERER